MLFVVLSDEKKWRSFAFLRRVTYLAWAFALQGVGEGFWEGNLLLEGLVDLVVVHGFSSVSRTADADIARTFCVCFWAVIRILFRLRPSSTRFRAPPSFSRFMRVIRVRASPPAATFLIADMPTL